MLELAFSAVVIGDVRNQDERERLPWRPALWYSLAGRELVSFQKVEPRLSYTYRRNGHVAHHIIRPKCKSRSQ